MQNDEGFGDRPTHVRVHRELGPRPVRARAKDALLGRDAVPALATPFPDARYEGFASQRLPIRPLAREHSLDDELRGDARVVRPRLPQRVEPAHSMPAHERVFQRAALRMAHMQRPRDVRGGHRHDVDGARVRGRFAGGEDAVLLPERVPAGLDAQRVIRLVESGQVGRGRIGTGHGVSA